MRTILFFILFGLSLSCQSQSTNQQKAIMLNNKALKVIWKPGDHNKNLKKANMILDSAIKIDPKNLTPYTNKLNNLISLKEYKRAIQVADSALKVKPVLEILSAKGALLQKTGNLTAAKQSYNKALEVGQSTYTSMPSANLLCNLAVVYRLRDGKEKALDFLKKEKSKFSNDPKGIRQINIVEKFLPNFTIDEILNVRPSTVPPPGVKKEAV